MLHSFLWYTLLFSQVDVSMTRGALSESFHLYHKRQEWETDLMPRLGDICVQIFCESVLLCPSTLHPIPTALTRGAAVLRGK